MAILIGEPTTVWQVDALPSAMQGVAVDGSYYYVSLTDELRKYRRSNDVLEWTVSTDEDYIDATTSQTNSAHVRDGQIYLGMLGGDNVDAQGIMVRSTSDGSFVRNIALNGIGAPLNIRSCEGGAFRPGTDHFFAVGRHFDADGGAQIYREIDLSDEANPSFVADHEHYDGVTGLTATDFAGGQGVVWVTADDGTEYVTTCYHDGNSEPYQVVVVHRWTGSALEFVSRRREPVYSHNPNHVAGQGHHLAPDGTEMWWSGRINSVDNGFVIRTSVEAVRPDENAFPNAVSSVFGSDLKVWLRLDEDSVGDTDELANSGDDGYTATVTQESSGPLPEPQRTARYQSDNRGFWLNAPDTDDAGTKIDISGASHLFVLNEPFTFACIASKDRITGSGTRGCLFAAAASGLRFAQFREGVTAGTLRVLVRDDTEAEAIDAESTGVPFAVNEPVRVVVTFNGTGDCDIYLNGVLDSSHSIDVSNPVTWAEEHFGRGSVVGRYWRGYFDEPIIAKRYLSADDVSELDVAMFETATLTGGGIPDIFRGDKLRRGF